MSRIRTVKPELFRHLALFEAEEKYRLPLRIAFVGLFTCCDRRGRFLCQPRRLQVDILPYDKVDISDVLNALVESGFIKAYEVDGIVYGCIPTCKDHQYFNNKEVESKLPDIIDGKILIAPIQQSLLAVHARLSEDAFQRRLSEQKKSIEDDAGSFPDFPVDENFIAEEDVDSVQQGKMSVVTKQYDKNSRVPNACLTRESLNGRERKIVKRRI